VHPEEGGQASQSDLLGEAFVGRPAAHRLKFRFRALVTTAKREEEAFYGQSILINYQRAPRIDFPSNSISFFFIVLNPIDEPFSIPKGQRRAPAGAL
jgi:hypothetical protein